MRFPLHLHSIFVDGASQLFTSAHLLIHEFKEMMCYSGFQFLGHQFFGQFKKWNRISLEESDIEDRFRRRQIESTQLRVEAGCGTRGRGGSNQVRSEVEAFFLPHFCGERSYLRKSGMPAAVDIPAPTMKIMLRHLSLFMYFTIESIVGSSRKCAGWEGPALLADPPSLENVVLPCHHPSNTM